MPFGQWGSSEADEMRDMVLRHAGAVQWLAFFSLVLLAWAALFVMQPNLPDSELARLYGAEFWASLCAPTAGQATYLSVFTMWVLMSAAMMAPTFVPTLRTFRDLTATNAASTHSFAALLFGFLLVWIGYSALAAALQLGLARAGLVGPFGSSLSLWLTAGLLLLAGAYQFSALKEACLSKCREPLAFFLGNWAEGARGAAQMGLKLGLVCLGCCWALMALAFVGGTMNLVWMGVATLLMVLEKLPEIGRLVTRPLGVGLLAGGLWTGLLATGLI